MPTLNHKLSDTDADIAVDDRGPPDMAVGDYGPAPAYLQYVVADQQAYHSQGANKRIYHPVDGSYEAWDGNMYDPYYDLIDAARAQQQANGQHDSGGREAPHFQPVTSQYQGYNGAVHEAMRVVSGQSNQTTIRVSKSDSAVRASKVRKPLSLPKTVSFVLPHSPRYPSPVLRRTKKHQEINAYSESNLQHLQSSQSISTTSSDTDNFTDYGLHRALNRTPIVSPNRVPTKTELKDQKYLEHTQERRNNLVKDYESLRQIYNDLEDRREVSIPGDYKTAVAEDNYYYEAYLQMMKAKRELHRFDDDLKTLAHRPKVTRKQMHEIHTEPRKMVEAQEMEEQRTKDKVFKLTDKVEHFERQERFLDRWMQDKVTRREFDALRAEVDANRAQINKDRSYVDGVRGLVTTLRAEWDGKYERIGSKVNKLIEIVNKLNGKH